MSNSADQWWVINGERLREALRRAHDGDDPDVVFLEFYVNSEHEAQE